MGEIKTVYLIKHKGQPVYVGSTKNMERRRQAHISYRPLRLSGSFAAYYSKNMNKAEYMFETLYAGPDWIEKEEHFIKEYRSKYSTIINASSLAIGNDADCYRSCTPFTREAILKSVATRKQMAGKGTLKKPASVYQKLREDFGTRVKCVETGEVFFSYTEAAKKFNTSHQTIMRAVNGQRTRLCHTFTKDI